MKTSSATSPSTTSPFLGRVDLIRCTLPTADFGCANLHGGPPTNREPAIGTGWPTSVDEPQPAGPPESLLCASWVGTEACHGLVGILLPALLGVMAGIRALHSGTLSCAQFCSAGEDGFCRFCRSQGSEGKPFLHAASSQVCGLRPEQR
jgi:hypothetical protein